MKNYKKKKWIIRIGLLLIIFASVLAKPIYMIIVNNEHWSTNELTDYKSLFNKEAQSNLHLFNTIESRLREPESQYIYNNEYNLFVTKIHIPNSFNLKKAINVKNKASNIENENVYFSLRSFNSKIHIRSEELSLVNGIELNIEGHAFNIVNTTENQAFYYFEFRTLSMIFNGNQSYMIAETNKSNVPAAIAFLKKGNLLYICMMTVAGGKDEMQPDQLFKILNKQ